MAKNIKKNMAVENRRSEKKAAVLGPEKTKKWPIVSLVVAILVIAGGVLAYTTTISKPPSPVSMAKPVAADPSVVTYPTERFDDGRARHFSYSAGKINIRYFVLKSSDGVIRAAFDACDVCWPANKGYYQEGDHMICRNCGRRFASVLVNVVSGGCNPAPLSRSVKGDQLVIKVDDILTGRQYFDFKKRT